MNSYQRLHEAAEKASRANWVKAGFITIPFSTKASADFLAIPGPSLPKAMRPVLVEVKTGKSRLSAPQRLLRKLLPDLYEVERWKRVRGKGMVLIGYK
jgi:hypothetical protein